VGTRANATSDPAARDADALGRQRIASVAWLFSFEEVLEGCVVTKNRNVRKKIHDF
jgi:hypothetical protein